MVRPAARISDPAGGPIGIPPATATPVSFDTVDFDSDGFANLGSFPTRLTVPTGLGGTYLIGGNANWTATINSYHAVILKKNGTTFLNGQFDEITANNQGFDAITHIDELVAGDYYELAVFVENNSLNTSASAPYLWMVRIEPEDSSDPFFDDFTGSNGAPWDVDKWDQSGPNGGSTTIQGNRGQAAGNSGNANSGGRGIGKQGNVPNQEMTGTFQLCETGEPCHGALWLQTSGDWEDLDNPTEGYGVYLPSDSNTATLVVANAGVVTTLDTATWPRDTGLKQYRFRRQSQKVRFRIWDDGDPEPSGWTLTGDDSSITPGDAGAFQVAYTCPTAPSVDACALFDAIDVAENNTPIVNGNGGNGGRGCCNGRNRRCCRRNRATQ